MACTETWMGIMLGQRHGRSMDRHKDNPGMPVTEGLHFRYHQPPSPNGHAEHCWPCLRVSSNGSSSRTICGCRSFDSLRPSSRHMLNSCSNAGQEV